jgi:hypothetical protein
MVLNDAFGGDVNRYVGDRNRARVQLQDLADWLW